MTTDCGCWTDGQGYWQLSDACRQVELNMWRDMMNKVESAGGRVEYRVRTPHEVAVAYFRQELRKDLNLR